MFKGWFKVHRLMLENDLWLAEKFTMGQAWVDLIGHANHKPGSVWIRGIEVKVNRGQIAWSELTMAHRWKWSRGKVRRYLGTLETRQMIVQQKSNQTSLVTICKYEVYQGGDSSESIPGDTADDTPSSTPDEHQTVHKQECNNVENEKKKDKGAAALDYSSWPESPDPQILADWKALRKSAKAPISQTVVTRFGNQLSRAKDLGFSVDDCLGKVIEKGWKGFNADWMANDNSSSFGQPATRRIKEFPKE